MINLKFIFLIGLPASGKSLVYQYLKKKMLEKNKVSISKIDDVEVLYSLFLEEKKNGFKMFEDLNGNFAVVDPKAYDHALAQINRWLLNDHSDDIRFIEFSRFNYDSAFRQFSGKIIKRSILIELFCPFTVCEDRNRFRKRDYASENPDDHWVPDFVMKKYDNAESFDCDENNDKYPFLASIKLNNVSSKTALEVELDIFFQEKVQPLLI